jgi:hypothetical protein
MAIILGIVSAFINCDFGVPDFKLTVFLEEGVTGTPDTGEYTYSELEVVNYSYSPVDSLHTVEAFLNDTRTSSVGTVTMYNDFSLTARLVDLRGSWNVEMQWTDSSAVDFSFSITLSGSNLVSGTFSDSRGFNGIWTAERGIVTITYTDWSDFVLNGSVFEMNGSFTGEGSSGAWGAARVE